MKEVIGLTPLFIRLLLETLQENLLTDEPIDDFKLCSKSKLDASLKTPFQRPLKENFIDELIEKSSLTFYFLIENHTLPTNGNKRLSTFSLLFMLRLNGYDLNATDKEIYDLAILVTNMSKKGHNQFETLEVIIQFLKNNLLELDIKEQAFRNKYKEKLSADFNEYLHSSS